MSRAVLIGALPLAALAFLTPAVAQASVTLEGRTIMGECFVY